MSILIPNCVLFSPTVSMSPQTGVNGSGWVGRSLLLYSLISSLGYQLEMSLKTALQGPVSVLLFVTLYYPLSDVLLSPADSALEDLIVEIITANNRGVSAAKNTAGEQNWSFGQSFFFSSTIVTTIGTT